MADRARSFGSLAGDYAEHRPDYPADGIRWALGGVTGPVLDLAAGTGKLTSGLLALGLSVTAEDTSVEWMAGLMALAGTTAGISAPERTSMPTHPLFSEPEVAMFPHVQRRTSDSLAETLGTHSRMIVIPVAEREAVLGRIRAYLSSRPETASGEFDAPLVTKVVRARRV